MAKSPFDGLVDHDETELTDVHAEDSPRGDRRKHREGAEDDSGMALWLKLLIGLGVFILLFVLWLINRPSGSAATPTAQTAAGAPPATNSAPAVNTGASAPTTQVTTTDQVVTLPKDWKVRGQFASKDEVLTDPQAAIDSLTTQLAEVRGELSAERVKVDTLTKSESNLKTQVATLTSSEANLTKEVTTLKANVATLTKQLQDEKKDNAREQRALQKRISTAQAAKDACTASRASEKSPEPVAVQPQHITVEVKCVAPDAPAKTTTQTPVYKPDPCLVPVPSRR